MGVWLIRLPLYIFFIFELMSSLESQFVSQFQSLSVEMQTRVLEFMKKLKNMKSKSAQSSEKLENQEEKKIEIKAGFGGAKGLFILNEGWDDPLTEEFKDYM